MIDVIILLALGYVIWILIKPKTSIKNRKNKKINISEKKNDENFGDFKTYDKYYEALNKAHDTTKLTKISIERFEKLIPVVLDIDKNDLAVAIGDAFESQYEDKNIIQLLKIFDDFQKNYSFIEFAMQNGAKDSFINTVISSLYNDLPQNYLNKNIINILTSSHPLLQQLRQENIQELAEWADMQFEKIDPDWEAGEFTHLHPEYLIEVIVKALKDKLTAPQVTALLKNMN